jgi:hypothetical protein
MQMMSKTWHLLTMTLMIKNKRGKIRQPFVLLGKHFETG